MILVAQDAAVTLAQIGFGNLLAISGGRYSTDGKRLSMPVAGGYRVDVMLAANDTYVVERVYQRGLRESVVKRQWVDVYCDEVGEIAYQASCFRDD